jgi:hypothetical protein
MTERWLYRSEVKANWKLYWTPFRFYHAPVLPRQTPAKFASRGRGASSATTGSMDPTGSSAPPSGRGARPGCQADQGICPAGSSAPGTPRLGEARAGTAGASRGASIRSVFSRTLRSDLGPGLVPHYHCGPSLTAIFRGRSSPRRDPARAHRPRLRSLVQGVRLGATRSEATQSISNPRHIRWRPGSALPSPHRDGEVGGRLPHGGRGQP